jgi:hypothetical protein
MQKPLQKPLVFISHITEEKEIALALKKLIEKTYMGMIDVFVSTDPTSIKPGRKWLDTITASLKSCKIEIILASPESVTRPWINFEAGAGWIRDIPVIPVCHSGMIPSKLPPPLSALQSAIASDETSMNTVFPELTAVARSLTPAVDFSEFISVVKAFEDTSRQISELKAVTPIVATDGLSPIEFATLSEIAESLNSPSDSVAAYNVRNSLQKAGFTGVGVVLALKMLLRKDFIEANKDSDYNNNEFEALRISENGWEWLEANQDRLKLHSGAPQPFDAEQKIHEDDIPF